MIIEEIREFIKTCPHLKTYNNALRINVNYLDEDPTSYSIEEIPCKPVLKKYVDGSTVNQYQFVFCSRESYSSDILDNIDNSGFYENFAEWINQKNRAKDLPNIEGIISINVVTNGYLVQTTEDKCRYQIDLMITYLRRN